MTQVAHNAPEREAWKSPDWRAWGGKAANWLRFLFLYVFEGHIIVDLGRWIVLFCGRVSETAMLLATLWITATFVIPEFTTKLGNLAVVLSSLSMVAFSLLPEVILFSAIIKTFKHWLAAWHNKRSPASWSWAILYSVPTVTFFAMTIYTITSFVSTNGHIQTTTGSGLVLRCLAGWFYSLVGLIHANIAKQKNEPQESHVDTQMPSVFDVMRQELATMRDQQTADLQAVLVRLEAQQKERFQTTVELVMERVTQTVIDRVTVKQTDPLLLAIDAPEPFDTRPLHESIDAPLTRPLNVVLEASNEAGKPADRTDFTLALNESVPAPLPAPLKDVLLPALNEVLGGGKTSLIPQSKTESKPTDSIDFSSVLDTYHKTASWQSTGQKTATVNEITTVTGHSKKMVLNRLKDGTLKTSGRNPELVRISSVIEWLKAVPAPLVNEPLNVVLDAPKEALTPNEKADVTPVLNERLSAPLHAVLLPALNEDVESGIRSLMLPSILSFNSLNTSIVNAIKIDVE